MLNYLDKIYIDKSLDGPIVDNSIQNGTYSIFERRLYMYYLYCILSSVMIYPPFTQ